MLQTEPARQVIQATCETAFSGCTVKIGHSVTAFGTEMTELILLAQSLTTPSCYHGIFKQLLFDNQVLSGMMCRSLKLFNLFKAGVLAVAYIGDYTHGSGMPDTVQNIANCSYDKNNDVETHV